MADIDVQQKPSGQYSTILMIVAILSIVGLMAWLAMESSRRPATVLESGTPAAGRTGGGSEVAFATLAGQPQTYAGQTVTISDVPIAATLGPRVFWTDVEAGEPFLAHLPSPDVGEAAAGQRYDLTGTVQAISEPVVDGWVQSGALDAGSRDVALSAGHFIEVTAVTPRAAAAPPVQ